MNDKSVLKQAENYGGISGCAREKYWSELDDSEKIARMRSEVKRIQSSIGALTSAMAKIADAAQHHEHREDGKVMMPLELRNGLMVADERSRNVKQDNEVYF